MIHPTLKWPLLKATALFIFMGLAFAIPMIKLGFPIYALMGGIATFLAILAAIIAAVYISHTD